MRQLYVSATSIVQIARLLPVLRMPDATVIRFCNIDHPDGKASANFRHARYESYTFLYYRLFRLQGFCKFYACEARRLYIFVTSSTQTVRLVSFLGIPDEIVIHFGSIDRSDCGASVIFRHPRRDSCTLLQHRSLRV